jgi:ETFB lysine methyltransferase
MNESSSLDAPLFDIPGGWRECELDIRGVRLRLTIPADPNRVLDAQVEAMQAGNADTDAELPDPYWAALWSAATPTAEAVMEAAWPPGTRILELGCGVGLAGLAALARGWRVTFSDYTSQALRMALHNARQNGYLQAKSLVLDWHNPPAASYDVILASDVLYQRQSHAPLLHAIDRLLAPRGVCWIGDPGRYIVADFVRAAVDRYHVQLRDREGRTVDVPRVGRFQLVVLRRRETA